MRMNQDEIRFDFHGLGLAIKQAREERGWTQAYVAELVGKTDRTIMNIENKGQHPSFNLFFKLVTMFDISVDQFFYREEQRNRRYGFGASPNKPPLCHLWSQRHCLPFSDTPKIAQKNRGSYF